MVSQCSDHLRNILVILAHELEPRCLQFNGLSYCKLACLSEIGSRVSADCLNRDALMLQENKQRFEDHKQWKFKVHNLAEDKLPLGYDLILTRYLTVCDLLSILELEYLHCTSFLITGIKNYLSNAISKIYKSIATISLFAKHVSFFFLCVSGNISTIYLCTLTSPYLISMAPHF